MTTYYKAVRPDGTDFYTGTINYLAGGVIQHHNTQAGSTRARHYLSVSTEKTDCTGFRWPARLLEVEAVGEVWTPHADSLPNKRAVTALKVIRELPAHELFGPQGEQVIALIDRVKTLTADEIDKLYAARAAAWDAAWAAAGAAAWYAARAAAWDAAWAAARAAAWYAARAAAWDAAWAAARAAAGAAAWAAAWDARAAWAAGAAALAIVVRDLISEEHYKVLTEPWAKVIGPVHPDDK